MEEPSKNAADVFHAALERTPGPDRKSFLDMACGDDAELRDKLEKLLAADAEASRFLTAPPELELEVETSGQRIGRYKLLQEIGSGGMGAVWMAEQLEPIKRRVALKIIKLGMDTKQVIARFEAERQALALMDHPHIAKVFDAGTTERGRPYFVMELVRGIPILEYCDREKLDTLERLSLFTKVCAALQHAHQKGIIHRDVKPSNVLVTLHDGVPIPKVIDFGIAKATNHELTERTLFTEHLQIVGTPAYMSPDQAELSGLDVDTRSDIYSLGVLLYELLTGTTPFDVSDLLESGYHEMLRAIREDEPHKPSTRISTLGHEATTTASQRRSDPRTLSLQVRGDLDWIVMKCLEKDRRRRYDTASALSDDIRRHLDHEPVLASPPTRSYRIQKFVRRNRVGVIAVSAVAGVLLLGILGTSFGFAWALDEKERADGEATRATQLAEKEKNARIEAQKQSKLAAEEAERATRAERDARERAEELGLVVELQSEQLRTLNVPEMGRALRGDLVAAAPEAQRAAFEEALSEINFTDVALSTLERSLFDRMLAAIDTQFAEQPLVQAHLLQTLNETFFELGLIHRLLGPQTRVLEIRSRELGEHDPITTRSRIGLGTMLKQLGEFEAANSQLELALETAKVTAGEDELLVAAATHSLATLREAQGRYVEAEELTRESIAHHISALGPEHADTLRARTHLPAALYGQGRYREAETVGREILTVCRRVLGNHDSTTLVAIGDLAASLTAQQRGEDAEPLLREALALHRELSGSDHPATLKVWSNIALMQFEQGDLLGAAATLSECYDAHLRVFGPQHAETLRVGGILGSMRQQLGDLETSEPLLVAALDALQLDLGEHHDATILMQISLGNLRDDQFRRAEAEELLRAASSAAREHLPPNHPYRASALGNLGGFLLALGEFEEGRDTVQEAYAVAALAYGDEDSRALNILNQLTQAYELRGEFPAAEAISRRVLAAAEADFGADSPLYASTLGTLGWNLARQERLEEAEPLLDEALELSQELHGLTSRATRDLGFQSAMTLAGLGQEERSLDLLREQVADCREVLEDHEVTAEEEHHLAMFLLQYDEETEALSYARVAVDRYEAHPEWAKQEAQHARQIFEQAIFATGDPAELERYLDMLLANMGESSKSKRRSLVGTLKRIASKSTGSDGQDVLALRERAAREALTLSAELYPEGRSTEWRTLEVQSLLGSIALQRAIPSGDASRLHEAETLLVSAAERLLTRAGRRASAQVKRAAIERVIVHFETRHDREPDAGHGETIALWRDRLSELEE